MFLGMHPASLTHSNAVRAAISKETKDKRENAAEEQELYTWPVSRVYRQYSGISD